MRNRLYLTQACSLAILVACLAGGGFAPVRVAAEQESVPTPAAGKWKTYRDDRYAFRLSYPPDSQVQTGRDHGYQYLRVHNYEPEPGGQGTMQPGEYHLEVLIFDHRLGHRMKSPCRELVRDAHQVRAGKVNALRGLAEQPDDASATSFALCLQAGKVDVLVMATEQDPLGPLANRILDGIRFGN
ncbi:MAG TPA: hypothetical protein VMH26_09520 [Burkholderiales bacterium]|nr:hypothetical protein [Burkholderiales bacterium]